MVSAQRRNRAYSMLMTSNEVKSIDDGTSFTETTANRGTVRRVKVLR